VRILRYSLIGVGALALLSLASFATAVWLLNTHQGTRWVIGIVESGAPVDISIGEIEGTLLNGVTLSDLEVVLEDDRLTVESLTVRWNPNDVFRGAMTFDELVAINVTYIRGEPDTDDADTGGFSAPIRIIVRQGSVDSIVLEAEDWALVFDDTTFALQLAEDRLLIDELYTRIEDVDVHTQGELRLSEDLSLSTEFTWSRATNDYEARGEGTLIGTLPRLALHHELAEPFQLSTDGEFLIEETLAADLEFRWADLRWPAVELASSPSGSLHIAGGLESYEFEGEGELVIDGTLTTFATEGSGDRTGIDLDAAELTTPQGRLVAQGRMGLDPLQWSLDVRAQDLDPRLRFANWPGLLQARASVEGRLDPALELTVRLAEMTGVLREYPVMATGTASFASDRWELDGVALQSGPNTVTASGVIGDAFMLTVSADAPDAGALWPDLAGELLIDAEFGGSLTTPAVRGTLRGSQLRWREYEVGELTVDATVASGDNALLDMAVDANGLRFGNLSIGSLQAQANGINSQHDIELRFDSEQWSGELQARGSLVGEGWTGELNDLLVGQTATGEWRLNEPVRLGLQAGRFSVGDFCLAQNSARVCGVGQVSNSAEDRLELTVTQFDLGTLEPLLPPDLSAEGVYEVSLSLTGPITRPAGTLAIEGGPTRAGLQEDGGESLLIQFDGLNLQATLQDDRIVLEGSLNGREIGSVVVMAEIADVWANDPTVQGELHATWNDLEFLSLLSPDVGSVSGIVNLDVSAIGALRAPEVEGRAQLRDGALEVPAWGLSMIDVVADATTTDLRTVEFSGSGLAGEGRADLNGRILLDPEAGWPTSITLSGESLQVVRLPDAEVDISPELEVRVELPDIQVTGTVHVPRALLALSELPAQAVTPSADTVIHGVEVAETFRPLNMQADLRLTLGDDVTYRGGGLTANITGDMSLLYESGQSAIASGIVDLDGSYETSGQNLNLERGRLFFAGPLDNPGLDVRAVREIESRAELAASAPSLQTGAQAGAIRVGVDLTGTMKAPQTRIFSQPAMSEADALSYLLFGRPLTGTEDAEAATLESAAVSMGLRQALPMIQRAGEFVGLDELSVQSTDADAGELMAGKYLSPRLYVRYTYGLFNRIGGLLLHFRMTDRFSLETRSGDEKSMDILYVVEKD